jgi:hypothetical protein
LTKIIGQKIVVSSEELIRAFARKDDLKETESLVESSVKVWTIP